MSSLTLRRFLLKLRRGRKSSIEIGYGGMSRVLIRWSLYLVGFGISAVICRWRSFRRQNGIDSGLIELIMPELRSLWDAVRFLVLEVVCVLDWNDDYALVSCSSELVSGGIQGRFWTSWRLLSRSQWGWSWSILNLCYGNLLSTAKTYWHGMPK
jgi:hypothetical protein